MRLRTDDALVLDDGRLVEVVAEPEPLIEVRADDLPALARLAWHLGDRHVPIQVLERRLRLRRDPAIEALLQSLGAKVVAIEAPFEPEGGAYAAPAGDHGTIIITTIMTIIRPRSCTVMITATIMIMTIMHHAQTTSTITSAAERNGPAQGQDRSDHRRRRLHRPGRGGSGER